MIGPTMQPNFRREMERSSQEIYEEFDRYLQSAVLGYGAERKRRWDENGPCKDAIGESSNRNRSRLIDMLGGFPDWKLELRPHCEDLFEASFCTGYSVEFDVLPGVRLRGILAIPKHVELPTAAVMAQHGYVSAPETVMGLRSPESVYHAYGLELARRGYVVFAHKNLSFREPRSQVHRKAMLIGETLLGMDVFQTSRVIDYLQTLPEVDPRRIGMYGISQGGMTTLYATACDTRIAASVVCAYFNDRTPKMVVSGGSDYTAYIDTEELDKDIHGMLDFTDVELATLICPRPLLIEAGRRDGSCHWPMVESEFAKVREVYRKADFLEQVELDLHDGGHEIHGVRSFPSLVRWLRPSHFGPPTGDEHLAHAPHAEA
ncbi:MAG: acetylxylan esterase, partial [Chloroflexi bacterium]|nr:acetylxylan esterase [Chloroflexota bacterium]